MKKIAIVSVGLGAAGVCMAIVGPTAATAAVNYFNETKTERSGGSAYCASGWKVTGGGASVPNPYFGSSYSDEYALLASYPYDNGWKATGSKVHGSKSSSGWKFTVSSYSPQVYVICTR